jgi:adenosylhomocysteine nucleosidase
MEGAAVAQAAHAWGVPFLIVRALSDSADGEAEVDFRAFTEFAADRSAKLVAAMLTRLPKN